MSIISDRSGFQIRPRFEVKSPLSLEEIFNQTKIALESKGAPCNGQARLGFITLYPPKNERHIWSPYLSVIIDEEEDGVLLRGHYGPSPTIWTLYILIYSFIALITLIVCIIGFANMAMGEPTNILWLLPVLCAMLVSMFLVSYYGQRKGYYQLMRMHHFFEDILGQHVV